MFYFDFANPDMPTGKRSQTTVPLQALFMMNNPLVIEQIKSLCNERGFKNLDTTDKRLDFLYERIYQRAPTSAERRVCNLFLLESPDDTETVLDRNAEGVRLMKEAAQKQRQFQNASEDRKIRMMRDQQAKKMTGGDFKQRAGLVKWEKLAHSMVMANEFFYVH